MFQMLRLSVVTLLLVSLPLNAQDYVPDELQGWQQWVLKDKAYRNCPFFFDRTSAARSKFLCAWPDRLQLEVVEFGGAASVAGINGHAVMAGMMQRDPAVL